MLPMSNASAAVTPLAAAVVTVLIVGRSRFQQPDRAADDVDHASIDGRFASRLVTRWFSSALGWWTDRRRARTRFAPGDLASWIDEVSRSVRRGATLRQTIIDTEPAHPSLAAATTPLRHRLARGSGVAEASDSWQQVIGDSGRRSDRHLIAVASVLSISSSVGGGASAPLDRLAAAMRQAAADDLERGSQSAQALISARVLTLVPVTMLALLVTIDAEVRHVASSATGLAVISCGLTLNALGAWWMKQIITAGSQ